VRTIAAVARDDTRLRTGAGRATPVGSVADIRHDTETGWRRSPDLRYCHTQQECHAISPKRRAKRPRLQGHSEGGFKKDEEVGLKAPHAACRQAATKATSTGPPLKATVAR
jgi:hypothetical protein